MHHILIVTGEPLARTATAPYKRDAPGPQPGDTVKDYDGGRSYVVESATLDNDLWHIDLVPAVDTVEQLIV